MMLWKAGLLGLVFFGFRLLEAAAPTTVSILGETAEMFGYAVGREWMASLHLIENRASHGAGSRIT
jgi:hypothetical protein